MILMVHRLHRRALALGVALVMAGCASLDPAPTKPAASMLIFEKEHLKKASSGRFFIRITTDGDSSIRGAQGLFEYLQFVRSEPYARSDVMLWIGPLGQSLGRIDRQTGLGGTLFVAYDGSKKQLSRDELGAMLGRLIGQKPPPEDIDRVLGQLFAVLIADAPAPNQHLLTQLRSGNALIEIRVALDP